MFTCYCDWLDSRRTLFIYCPSSNIVTGRLNEQGQMTFGLCSYQKPFHVLSNFQLEGLQGRYSCDCRVSKTNTDYRSMSI